jgi:predicted RNA binding protein YcfA (HicA-like mRNA interferase family)
MCLNLIRKVGEVHRHTFYRMRLTPLHRKDFVRRLRKLGWEGPVPGGKHEFMVKGKYNLPIPNPHGSGEISVSQLKEILREIGISREEWISAS